MTPIPRPSTIAFSIQDTSAHRTAPGDQALDLSVVIVNWNVADLLASCINSVCDTIRASSFEVIVVDNASNDNSLCLLRDRFPWVRVISNETNVGFACANNQAFEQVKGKYIFVLNPDTVVQESAIERMVEFMHRHPTAGVVGPRLVLADGSTQQSCARLLPTIRGELFCGTLRLHTYPGIGKWFFRKYYSRYSYDFGQKVESISGAAMLIRHSALIQLRGFGETYLHCGEDLDFCWRATQSGWGIFYVSDCSVIHFSGQSSKQDCIRVEIAAAKSIFEFFRLNYGLGAARKYKIQLQVLRSSLIVVKGAVNLLLGRENYREFFVRFRIARALASPKTWRTRPNERTPTS